MMGELYRFEERKTRRFQQAAGLRNMKRHMQGRAPPAPPTGDPRGDEAGAYWDEASSAFAGQGFHGLWRRHSDLVNAGWVDDWLGPGPLDQLLKTDLFDELVGGGLLPLLRTRARAVSGVDISPAAVRIAGERYPELDARVADVRRLPYADERFDRVVSNSTLDHFRAEADIGVALRELFRVLRPGGELLISLDNLQNPAVRLRNALPQGLLRRSGLVPYFVGATLDRKRLLHALRQAGFEPRACRAILHCPRVLAVPLAGALQRWASEPARRRFLAVLLQFERLAGWPSAYYTGHFVAVRARKPLSTTAAVGGLATPGPTHVA
jgi:SAM-dependent methyltransferase